MFEGGLFFVVDDGGDSYLVVFDVFDGIVAIFSVDTFLLSLGF